MSHRVTHTCGHEQEHHLTGFASQQERKAKWLATTMCGACFRAEKAREREAEATQNEAAIADLTLLPLAGSERQVSWATAIRAKRIALLRTSAGLDTPETGLALLGITDAKWWIDHRDQADDELLALARGDVPLQVIVTPPV